MAKMTKFSSWNADAVLGRYMVDGNKEFLLDNLIQVFRITQPAALINMMTDGTRSFCWIW